MITCAMCDSTGTVHIEKGEFVNATFDLSCWVCCGTALKGMDRKQVKWYKAQYKSLDSLKDKILRAGRVEDETAVAYATVRNQINKVCSILGIALQPVPHVKSNNFGITDQELYLRAELKEYGRRLTQIPLAIAAKTMLFAA